MALRRRNKDPVKIPRVKRTRHSDVEEEGEVDETNWLISYADLMTLLMGFFVLLYSMSKVDEAKYEQMREGIAKKLGGKFESKQDKMAEFVKELIKDTELDGKVTVKTDALGVSVVFTSTVFFDSLSAEIKAEGIQIMRTLIDGIRTKEVERKQEFNFVVEGHSDSRPVVGGNFPSNWELSSARASRVVRMFIAQGFPSKRLTAIGYADKHPEEKNLRLPNGDWNENALAQNRRVVIRILEPGVDFIPKPNLSKDKALDRQGNRVSQRTPAASSEAKPVPPVNPAMPSAKEFPDLD